MPGKKAGRIYTVCLEKMEFFAFHGVLPEEKAKGNVFLVDLEYDYCSNCGKSDMLEDAVDYARVCSIVKQQMSEPRKLLETLADSICEQIMKSFPQVLRVEVKIKKKNPPVDAKCEWSGVKTSIARQ